MIGGQRQAGVLAQVIDRLHQAFAKGGLADDEGAVVVLQGAADNLRGRSRSAVDHHHDGKALAAVAVRRCIIPVWKGAPALADDALPLGEQMVADLDRLVEQSAGIAPQVEDQPLQVAKAVDGLAHFGGRRLLELRQMDVAHAWANLVG